VQHSPEYYYWKVADRLRRLRKVSDSPELYDDLAVAYSKLGLDEKAIKWIKIKNKKYSRPL